MPPSISILRMMDMVAAMSRYLLFQRVTRILKDKQKKDHLIYSSPSLDTASESNAGAVSTSAKMLEPITVGVPLLPINQAIFLP